MEGLGDYPSRRMIKDKVVGDSGDSSLSNKHIRFDDKSVTNNDILPSNKKKKNKKRKRNHTPSADTATTTNDKETSSCNKNLFNGLILAISTLESKQTNTTSSSATTINTSSIMNNKTLKQTLKSHGATISPQVHKKVHYLIATDSAIQNLTQRVRQAYKRNVDIVNVNWIDECIKNTTKKCSRVDVEAYICNELVKTLIDEKEREKEKQKTSDGGDDGNTSDIPAEDTNGWSTPIELDCCCVCHENGDDNCPWCTGPENTCNLTLARLARKQQCTKAS